MYQSLAKKLLTFSLLLLFPFISGSSNLSASFEFDRFYLANYTTYAPGSDVKINLYAYSTGNFSYRFRLLKITEPVEFFSILSVGSMRNNFDVFGKDKEVLLKYTSLVKEWNQSISSQRRYGRTDEVNVGKIDKAGIYIVQAMRDDLVAYCGVVVSDLAMVYKSSGNNVLGFVANAQTSEFIKNVRFNFYSNGKLINSKISDADGIVNFQLPDSATINNNSSLIIAQTGEETVLSDPYFYFRRAGDRNLIAYVYTNQPVYRPGQQVYFKAIVRNREGNNLLNIQDKPFNVTVRSPRNDEVFSKELTTNEFGSLSGNLILDEEADLGNYTIQLSDGERNYYGSFSVEEYKKPEFFVEVEPGKEQYAIGDSISAEINAGYYFGSPVTNGDVKINVYRRGFWRPWWYFSDYSWFYRSFASTKMYLPFMRRELIYQTEGKLSDEGKYSFKFVSEPDDRKADYIYVIEAEVTDNSRRAITGSGQVYVTRGSFNLSTSPDRYFVEKGKEVLLNVTATDFSDNPVETSFKVFIRYPGKRRTGYSSRTDSLYGSTDKFGRAVVPYLPDQAYTGHFQYTVKAVDEKGREITANSSFFVGDRDNYFYGRSGSLEIVTDKDTYEKGDSLIAYVFLPFENTELLATYETESIIGYKKYVVEGNSFTIREKLTGEFSPSFKVSISFLKERQFYNTSKLIGVLSKDKFLDISVIPNKQEYKPGEKAEYFINVKDQLGNPVKNTEISIGIVDESIYAIQEENVQKIEDFFYAPKYSYIPTYSSLNRSNLSGYSRPATYIDKYYFDRESIPDKKGNGSLQGKIQIEGEDISLKGTYVLLSNEYNYYTTEADEDGNYSFKDIQEGEYDLLIVRADGTVKFIDKINIDEESEYDIDLEPADIIIEERAEFDNVAPVMAEALTVSGVAKDKSANFSGIAADEYVQPELRSNFVDAVIWKAHIVTDRNGEAEVTFDMPDNLTTWRATVRGVTENTEVGQMTHKVITRKDLLVRMEIPRFLREGDVAAISTIVHNYLDEKKKTKISFNVENLKLLKAGTKESMKEINGSSGSFEFTIDKNTELRIDWIVEVEEPIGTAVLKAEALTNEESDAVQLKLPLLPKGIKQVNPVVADYDDENAEELLEFVIPSGVDIRTAAFSFSVTPSIAGTMLKALDELAGYPYGCVEQTMSRFLPTIIVANTFKEIDAPLKSSTIEKLPDMVEAGLKRLYKFQHSDGGWGWWEQDDTHPYMTAYVIYGLTLAKNAGYKIDEQVYSRGVENLKRQIENFSKDDETTLSYMLYSFTTAMKDKEFNSSFYKETIDILSRKELNSYALSLLAISALNLNEKELANNIADELVESAVEEGRLAYWGGKQWHYRWQDDKVQSTAFAVKALLNLNINPELVTKAVRWLIVQKQGFSWRSTQETATVIFALTDYLKQTQELTPDFSAEVYVNGKEVFDGSFSADDVFDQPEITKVISENLKPGTNEIQIVKNGKGKLYFSGENEYFIDPDELDASDNEFKITREYYILDPQESSGRFLYLKKKFNGKVQSGQDILVKTIVEPVNTDMQYFMLEDMLPAGFEVVKDMGKYEIEGENRNGYGDYIPYIRHYAAREYRDEKTVFFVTYTSDRMEFSYIIKAQIPGKYTAAPSQGSLMYYPEISGFSEYKNIEITDL